MTNLNGGDFSKFIVVKTEDTNRLSKHERDTFSHLLTRIYQERGKAGKKQDNTYLVVNTDEPYADKLVQILKQNGHWGKETKYKSCSCRTWDECTHYSIFD